MDPFSHISYLEQLLFVACGFLTLQYLQIVLITKYSFSDSDCKFSDETFPRRNASYHITNSASSRRPSQSLNTHTGYSKRRGRRTFGIKHL